MKNVSLLDPSAGLSPEDREKVMHALPSVAPAIPRQERKLLVLNVNVREGGRRPHIEPSIPHGNCAIEAMGSKTGSYSTEISTDIDSLAPANLRRFDAICFNSTTGDLTRDESLRNSLLSFVASGKGFIAFHAGGGATFVDYPRYDQFPQFGEMVGGYESGGHPWGPHETIHLRVEDPSHPINSAFAATGFDYRDQVFQFREPYSRDKVRVLLSIDPDKSDFDPVKRRFLPERLEDRDFPMSWIKRYGSGRVFYTVFGHNPSTFWNPVMLQHFLAGIQYALGDLEADDTPGRPNREPAR